MNNLLRAVVDALRRLPAALVGIRSLPRQFCIMVRAICRRVRLQHRGEWPSRPPTGGCCLNLTAATARPDPLLYLRSYLMARGLAVTWNNPDIELYDGGVPVSSSGLEPDHEYEVRVRVWNGSYNSAAINLPVHLSFLTFGIATTSTPIGVETIAVLGAKGTATQPALVRFRWRTPSETGHYCLQALLECPNDANPDNNLGQENVQVGRLASPARFEFTVRNQAAVRRTIEFETDIYQLPSRARCGDEYAGQFGKRPFPSRLAESRAHWEWATRNQPYEGFPVKNDWRVSIEPRRVDLDSGEQRLVEVRIEPVAAGFEGRRSFNIHGFAVSPDGALRQSIGGVTLLVSR